MAALLRRSIERLHPEHSLASQSASRLIQCDADKPCTEFACSRKFARLLYAFKKASCATSSASASFFMKERDIL
jgi:hypothetical protein